jgi:hypothetical protein
LRGERTVIEAPPMTLGALCDFSQGEVLGIGPTGPDKGRDGKFLILPPAHEDIPLQGCIVAKSRT